MVLCSSSAAAMRGARVLAHVAACADSQLSPERFPFAPAEAAKLALKRAGVEDISEVDLWEVNEAFAVVPMAAAKEIGIPHERLNVRGGAISLGHPIGASGARILVTLIAALRERGLRRGVAAICVGGGEGLALCVELAG